MKKKTQIVSSKTEEISFQPFWNTKIQKELIINEYHLEGVFQDDKTGEVIGIERYSLVEDESQKNRGEVTPLWKNKEVVKLLSLLCRKLMKSKWKNK